MQVSLALLRNAEGKIQVPSRGTRCGISRGFCLAPSVPTDVLTLGRAVVYVAAQKIPLGVAIRSAAGGGEAHELRTQSSLDKRVIAVCS